MTAQEMAKSSVSGWLQKLQHVSGDAGSAALTTTAKVIELKRESLEMKRENASLFNRNTNTEAKFVETSAAKSAMRGHLDNVERQTTNLKTQLAKRKFVLEKLVG